MRRAIYFISIDGQDVTSNFAPFLIRLQIRLTDGGESDTCEISLDDSAGQLPLRGLYDELVAAGVKASLVGGAFEASELDAKRAIDQASRLAAVV